MQDRKRSLGGNRLDSMEPSPSKSTDMVSASDVGRAAFCPRYLELKYKGIPVSGQAQRAREAGIGGHQRVARQADQRCYIASHLYGPHDPRTERLRHYRDGSLLPHPFGQLVVAIYYRISPSVVRIAQKWPLVHRAARLCVDRILRVIGANQRA